MTTTTNAPANLDAFEMLADDPAGLLRAIDSGAAGLFGKSAELQVAARLLAADDWGKTAPTRAKRQAEFLTAPPRDAAQALFTRAKALASVSLAGKSTTASNNVANGAAFYALAFLLTGMDAAAMAAAYADAPNKVARRAAAWLRGVGGRDAIVIDAWADLPGLLDAVRASLAPKPAPAPAPADEAGDEGEGAPAGKGNDPAPGANAGGMTGAALRAIHDAANAVDALMKAGNAFAEWVDGAKLAKAEKAKLAAIHARMARAYAEAVTALDKASES